MNENSYKTVLFNKQTKTRIGNTTYIVKSYFDDKGEGLPEKIKHLLISEVQNLQKNYFEQAKI